jgi:hypothetical protein
MQTWKWLYAPETSFNWRFIRNAVIKTAVLFVAANIIFALLDPLPTLGKLTGYNWLFPGRERLPYGENSAASYNLSLYQIDAMFSSHDINDAQEDEFRVVLIGDSATWGILLTPEETLAGQLNAESPVNNDGKPIRVYNLGYPTMSLTKDLMLLDYAMQYDPDLVVWLFTMESFDREGQLDSPIVQNNPDRMQPLISTYNLGLNRNDDQFVQLSLWGKTIIKRRRALADLLRLQYYGVAWSVTGIDQEYRDDYTPRAIDLEPDETWRGFNPGALSESDLAFDVLAAGQQLAGDTPILFVNEPMMISNGENSDLRYNAFYPRWAYDDFRQFLHEYRDQHQWMFLDLWNKLPEPDCYTDSAVHLTPECSTQLADHLRPIITQIANDGTFTMTNDPS